MLTGAAGQGINAVMTRVYLRHLLTIQNLEYVK